MLESIVNREITPHEVADVLRIQFKEEAAQVARDMMHTYHTNEIARTYWCEVVYYLEKSN